MRQRLLTILLLIGMMPAGAQDMPEKQLVAEALVAQGKNRDAIHVLNEMITNNPADMDVRYNRGMCYFQLKEFNSAVSDFQFINKRNPARASFMLAKCQSRLNRPELAIKYLREHLDSRYKLPEREVLLDPDLMLLEDIKAWGELWREKEWYTTYEQQLQEAVYQKERKNYLEALNTLNALNKKGHNRTKVEQYLAEIYLKNDNQKAASEALDQSIRSDYKNIEARKMRIDLNLSTENYTEALSDCNALLRQAPGEFDYYRLKGRICAQTGDFDEAVESVKLYINLFPDSSKAYNDLGFVYIIQNQYLKAISSLNKALELYKGDSEYYYNRGKCYYATGMEKYAIKDFSMALDLDPDNAETWYYMGKAEQQTNNLNRACYSYKKAYQYGKKEALPLIQNNCN